MVVDICGDNKKELDMDIKDRVIVVTGAASGIGKSLVKIFYKHGAKHVVSADVNIVGIKEVAKEYPIYTSNSLRFYRSTNRSLFPFHKIGRKVLYKREDIENALASSRVVQQ